MFVMTDLQTSCKKLSKISVNEMWERELTIIEENLLAVI